MREKETGKAETTIVEKSKGGSGTTMVKAAMEGMAETRMDGIEMKNNKRRKQI